MNHRIILLGVLLVLSGCGEQGGDSGGGDGGLGLEPGVNPDPGGVFPSVGLPDYDSFTMSADVFNLRGFNFNGTTATITIHMADQLNNSSTIPDGTTVYFATSGGAVDFTCQTVNGSCSTTWRSQEPRPAMGPIILDPLGSGENVAFGPGRAMVLAWTEGTESFIDNNSNGLFDDGDTIVPGSDLPEPFLDRNGNGVRDNDEEFVNYPQIGTFPATSGTYDGPDGLYSGANCAHSTLCAANQSVFIFGNLPIIMSTDGACLVEVNPPVLPGNPYWETTSSGTVTLDTVGAPYQFFFLLHDCHGNPPINGTTIGFNLNGSVGDFIGPSSFTVPNTTVNMGIATDDPLDPTRQRYPTNSLVYGVTVMPDPANADQELGFLEVTVNTPAIQGAAFQVVTLIDPVN